MYRPTKLHCIQGSKAYKSCWCNENIYKTQLQFMYEATFKYPKKLCDKCVMVVNKNLEIYEACQHKTNIRRFFVSTDDPV